MTKQHFQWVVYRRRLCDLNLPVLCCTLRIVWTLNKYKTIGKYWPNKIYFWQILLKYKMAAPFMVNRHRTFKLSAKGFTLKYLPKIGILDIIAIFSLHLIRMTFAKTSKTKQQVCRAAISSRVVSITLEFQIRSIFFHILEESKIECAIFQDGQQKTQFLKIYLKGADFLLGRRGNMIFTLFSEAKVDFAKNMI